MKQIHTTPHAGVSRAVLALALAGSCAWAQAEPQATPEETELAPITVSAHEGLDIPYDSTGVSVTVLDVAELRDTQDILTVSDALTTVPGLYVMPGGGLNQQGNVSYIVTRGLKGDAYTQCMVDGMRLNTGSGNGLVSSNFIARANMYDLGTIEMLRGAQGATYGGGSLAGVLYMETPEGKGAPSYTLSAEGGSHDSFTGNATAQGKVKKLAYFLSATYTHTNNDFKRADGSKFDLPHAGRATDWAEALRLDYDINESAKATLTYRREDATFNYASTGMDYTTYAPTDTRSPYTFVSNLATAKVETKVNARYTTSLMAGYYGTDNNLSSDGYPFYTNIRNVQTEWRNAYKWNDRHTTTGGLAWNRSLYTADSGSGKRNADRSLENVYALFAEHTYTPRKNWENSLALRGEESSIYDGQFSLRASSSLKFNKEMSRVFASAGQGFRSPSAFQHSSGHYSSWGTTYYGNPNLDPETSYSADLGFEQQVAKEHFLSATLFITRTEDRITTAATATPGSYVYVNSAGHATAQGIELAAHGTFEQTWKTGYTASCTLTDPKQNNKQMNDTARQVWSADIHTSPIEQVTTGVGLSAASGRNDYARRKQDAYYTLRWYADYKATEHLTFHVRIENLTNQKFVAEPSWMGDDYGLLNAGTSLYAGCTLTF